MSIRRERSNDSDLPRVFGSICYIGGVNASEKKKDDPLERAIYLGYFHTRGGHLVFNLKRKVVLECINAACFIRPLKIIKGLLHTGKS